MLKNIAHLGSLLSNNSRISEAAVPQVRVNGVPISVVGDRVSDGDRMVEGSSMVRARGRPVCRLEDRDSRGHQVVDDVSPNVRAF